MMGALIFGDRGTVLELASRSTARWGAVALPAVAARAHVEDLLTTDEWASAFPQRNRFSRNSPRRHACPGGLDNGSRLCQFLRDHRLTGLLTVAELGPCRCHGRVPCQSRQPHHTAVKLVIVNLGRGTMTMDAGGLWKWRARGKYGKAKAAFPHFPPSLGNLAKTARFPHFHSPGAMA